MTAPMPPGREPAWRDVVTWFETIDAILRGLAHSLNNRALALNATIESLDARRPLGDQMTSALAGEGERLTEQLRQLRALPFSVEEAPMPLLPRDVITTAVELHRSHASLGDIPVYLEGTAEAPPVLAPEPAMVHAILVTLTALKRFVAPGGVVRIRYAGTSEWAEISFSALRDPSGDVRDEEATLGLVRPTALATALLAGALLETEQRIGGDAAVIVWVMPSLRAMRRRGRAVAVDRPVGVLSKLL